MAQITSQDYQKIRKALYTLGAGKEELKALPSLPNESQLLDCLQDIEDATISHFTGTIKPAIDTALGVTTSITLAKKIYGAYLLWKLANL